MIKMSAVLKMLQHILKISDVEFKESIATQKIKKKLMEK